MKKLIFLVMIIISFNCSAQYVRKVNDTTYTFVPAKPFGTYTSEEGIKYPLYRTINGKLYYWRESKKTGKFYKAYLKQ